MIKLYYSPGFCSLATHILLRELRLNFFLIKVDMKTKRTSMGEDFLQINPKGQVPYLVTNHGFGLGEGQIIAQYLLDQIEPNTFLFGTVASERYRVLEWQAFLATEVHKAYLPLFHPEVDPRTKAIFSEILRSKYQLIDTALSKGAFLVGQDFTAADAYLFTVTRWAKFVGLDLDHLLSLEGFMKKMLDRPHVLHALEAEGLN